MIDDAVEAVGARMKVEIWLAQDVRLQMDQYDMSDADTVYERLLTEGLTSRDAEVLLTDGVAVEEGMMLPEVSVDATVIMRRATRSASRICLGNMVFFGMGVLC